MADRTWDVVVVGAGVAGCWTAYHVASSGQSVLLLDQFPLPHTRGSSQGCSRLTFMVDDDEFWPPFKQECHKLWRTLEQESQQQLMLLCGFLYVEGSPHEHIERCMQVMHKHHLGYTYMDNQRLHKEYPMLSYPEDTVGLLDHQGGMLVANKCLTALNEMISRRGGIIRDGDKVQTITPGKVVTIATSKNTYRAKSVVLTPGPWANDILQKIDLDLPLKTMPGWPTYWHTDGTYNYKLSNNFPFLIEYLKMKTGYRFVMLTPEYEYPNMVKFATRGEPPPSYLHPDRRDEDDKDVILKFLQRYIEEHMKGIIAKPSLVEPCMYTMTPDRKPVLDTHPKYDNVIVGTGFSGNGFHWSPVMGKLLCELALGKPPSYDISSFRMARFGESCHAKI